MFNKFMYGIRWQLSGLVLLPVVWFLGPVWGVIIGNFIGAIIFWSIDKYLTK